MLESRELFRVAKVHLSKFDLFLANWIPAIGRGRIQNKIGIARAEELGLVGKEANVFPRGGGFPSNSTSGGYAVPGGPSTAMKGWTVSPNIVEHDTLHSLPGLRAASRDMWTNTPIAVAALRRVQTNVVGFGLTMQSRIDQEALGMSPEEAEAWQRKTEREWRYWSQSKDCDARRTCDFYELQALAILSEMLSGDVFALLPYVPKKGSAYKLAVQLIEADWISNPYSLLDSLKVTGGVEVDSNGAPVAYHLQTLPLDTYITPFALLGVMDWKRIPAFGGESGRRNVLHLFRADRPGQRRGVPFLAPVVQQLKNLTRLTESELTAAVIASFFTAFMKDIPKLGGGFVPGDTVIDPNSAEADTLFEMGPGTFIGLPNGKEIQIADPKRPNGAFEPFFMAITKQIGAALEIPFEQVLMSFNASYSASRAALLEAWKFYKTYRFRLVRSFCQPTYEEWLTEAVASGRIKAPGFFEDPAIRCAWAKSRWIGPGQGQLNPDVESKASVTLIDAGLSTHEEEYAERQGGDWEAAAYALSRENKLKETLGIKSQASQLAEKKIESDNSKKQEKLDNGG